MRIKKRRPINRPVKKEALLGKRKRNSVYQALSKNDIQKLLSFDASKSKSLIEREMRNMIIGPKGNQDKESR